MIRGGIHKSEGSENSTEFQDLAKFAVDEHNNKQNEVMEIVGVLRVKTQVTGSITYYLTIEVKDGRGVKVYEAKLWLQPWINFKELVSFQEVDSAATFCCCSKSEAEIMKST